MVWGDLIGGYSVQGPERACRPQGPTAYQLASLQGEKAGGQGTQGREHLTHPEEWGGGDGAFARYEVVWERMSKPADASHISISCLALSPELWAYKSAPQTSTPEFHPQSYSS